MVKGKHVVTVEGINMQELNPVQQAMSDEGATQCGFCTPGFVMSLAGFCLSRKEMSEENARASIDGNICRCTGYKSIERAAIRIAAKMKDRNSTDPLSFAAENAILPGYFREVRSMLLSIESNMDIDLPQITADRNKESHTRILAGGTDLYVQVHEEMEQTTPQVIEDMVGNKISSSDNHIHLAPSVTVTDFFESELIQQIFPNYKRYKKLISSTPIRNMATIAGNFVNASPIGDLTIFLLALNATVELKDRENGSTRCIALDKLYKGYKQLDILPAEFVSDISFAIPSAMSLFHFEKVSKRMHLDIASVNTAIGIQMSNDTVIAARISAGGVSAIPLFLVNASSFLTGKKITEEIIIQLLEKIQLEISPISDARGTADYKRLLLSQLVKAHFIEMFPSIDIKRLLRSHS
jgi:xanthine dehydrogenase small subunit